jgi:hypothetical protein
MVTYVYILVFCVATNFASCQPIKVFAHSSGCVAEIKSNPISRHGYYDCFELQVHED